MTPFTCRVVNSLLVGVPGVHVMLDCRDTESQAIACFESVTDGDGGIGFWFPLPSIGQAGAIQPEIVDTSATPCITLRFFPSNSLYWFAGGPWLSIITDLFLADKSDHGVILHLGASPRLEHTPYPVAGPTSLSMPAATRQHLALYSRSPSPLTLPPQLSPTGSGSTDSSNMEEKTGHMVTRSRKRALKPEKMERNTRAKLGHDGKGTREARSAT